MDNTNGFPITEDIMTQEFPKPSEYARYWSLDPATVFLNHGSFGACPVYVSDKQRAYREQMEREPVRFMMREMEEQFEAVRKKVAAFIHAGSDDLVFVQNATSGVSTVFRSLQFNPGDEILCTNHIYPACKRVLEYVCERSGAILVEVLFDFPVDSPEIILDAVMKKVSQRTRIVLIDHISSATALIHPVKELVAALNARGIDTMIDGAHALGSIPLDVGEIGAAYYTANCHKWLCTPKSAAVLHVRADRQSGIVPLIISHAGHRASSFAERFFWPGTYDPSAVLCVSDSLDYFSELIPGGWETLMKRNHDLCLEARTMLCDRMGVAKPCPDSMIATMATLILPHHLTLNEVSYKGFDPFQDLLFRNYHIEIPVWNWTAPPQKLIRIAVQLYNSMDQYRYLAEVLTSLSVLR